MIDKRPAADRLLIARLTGEAQHRAQWRPLSKAEEAAGVAALRELADGRADLLAEVAGLLEGFSEGELDEALVWQAADLCRAAGADPEAIPAWIEEGQRRREISRLPPFSGGLRLCPGRMSRKCPTAGIPTSQDTSRSRACVRFVPLVHHKCAPHVSCSGSVAIYAALGEEVMSYRPPPDRQPEVPARPPPGWYLDPGGLRALRWWDGAQWSPHTQPLPRYSQAPRPPYPDATTSGTSEYEPSPRYQEGTGRHRRQSELQDDMAHGSLSPGEPEQQSFLTPEPKGSPGQQPGTPEQGAYAPEPQPQVHPGSRRPKNRKARAALIGAGTLIVIIVSISVAATHNSPSGNTAATAAAASATAASSTTPSCQDQAVSWKDNGGASDVNAMTADLSGIQKATYAIVAAMNAGGDLSSAESALQSSSASLQSDAQSAETDLPPTCIPGVRGPYAQALVDYSKAAGDFQDSVSEMSSGSTDVAVGDVQAGNAAMSAGNGKITTATTALTAFDNSQS